jgi:hypothetical protein
LSNVLFVDEKYNVLLLTVSFKIKITVVFLVLSALSIQMLQIAFVYHACVQTENFGVAAYGEEVRTYTLCELDIGIRHLLVELMVDKCQVELHFVSNHWLLVDVIC